MTAIGRAAFVIALALAGPGCTGDDSGAIERVDGPLTGVCPDPVVVQSDWHPEAEHAAIFQLVDPNGYAVDTDAESVTGRLVSGGVDMGVDIEIRMGGEAIGFQQVPARMHEDPAILLGVVGTDEAIANDGNHPTVGVLALLQISPMMVMWDPATYDVDRIADLPDDTVVSVFGPDPYFDHLVAERILTPGQLDWRFTGTPDRFVEAAGAIAQQGSATTDPYLYEHEVDGWERPVRFQLAHDTGWEPYVAALSVRPDTIATRGECLEALVPIVQQAIVDHVADPAPAHALIVDLVERFDNGWRYERDLAEWSFDQQRSLGMLADGPDGVVGTFDLERIDRFLDRAVPLIGTGDGLRAADLVTNRFVDPSIGLGDPD